MQPVVCVGVDAFQWIHETHRRTRRRSAGDLRAMEDLEDRAVKYLKRECLSASSSSPCMALASHDEGCAIGYCRGRSS
jgi:hypothetical protein